MSSDAYDTNDFLESFPTEGSETKKIGRTPKTKREKEATIMG